MTNTGVTGQEIVRFEIPEEQETLDIVDINILNGIDASARQQEEQELEGNRTIKCRALNQKLQKEYTFTKTINQLVLST